MWLEMKDVVNDKVVFINDANIKNIKPSNKPNQFVVNFVNGDAMAVKASEADLRALLQSVRMIR